MEKPVIRLENVTQHKSSGFSLDIPRLEFRTGRIYSITGHNGSGKTTLLNVLNLLERPDSGEISFNGEKVTHANSLEIRRMMGMVMENPYIFNTTVYRNIAVGLRCHSVDRKKWDSSVEEVLRMVGLEGFEKRYATELSRGESQRVAIARVLALRPEILFLDEPFSNIDRKHVSVLEELIQSINKKYRTTAIFTTHDPIQARRLADETISLADGRVATGSID